jgi:hypothetical protein
VRLERDGVLEKQSWNSDTEEGMQIDESDGHFENASPVMLESVEPDANVIMRRDLHSEKQSLRVVREGGMQMDESREQP